jgi:hypothetical protein
LPQAGTLRLKTIYLVAGLIKAGGDPNKLVKQENGLRPVYTPVTLATELLDAKSLKLLLDNNGDTSLGGNKKIFKSAPFNMSKFLGQPGRGGMADMYTMLEMLEKHEQSKEKPDKSFLKIYSNLINNLNAMIAKLCSDKEKYLQNSSQNPQDKETVSFILAKCE